MANTEYKLSYTAAEIDEKLGMVDQLSADVENLETEVNSTVNVIKGGTGLNSITTGNFIIGNGTEPMLEMTPEDVLSYINGASVMTLSTAEYEALGETDSNTLYMLTDAEEEEVLVTVEDIDAICGATV